MEVVRKRHPDRFEGIVDEIYDGVVAGKTESELYAMGVCIPPLHGRCRSQLVFVL